MIFHANGEQKEAGVVTLISNKIESEWMKKEKPENIPIGDNMACFMFLLF